MRHTATLSLALALAPVGPLALGPASSLPAQAVTLDEGSLTVTRRGAPAGREDFVIRRLADAVIASATVSLPDRRLYPALKTDPTGAPLRYQIEVKRGTETVQQVLGIVGHGRFSVQVKTPGGESTREYVVSDDAIVLDDDVFNQYYFLSMRPHRGSQAVIVPQRNTQVTMRVEQRAAERIEIGGTPIQATHLVLTPPDGHAREVWLDPRGRVLKVVLSDQGIVALRDDPPAR